VFVDIGQWLFREVMNGSRSFGDSAYRAPEGVKAPSSDLFSLGGLFVFLGTGRQPIGLNSADMEGLKQQITLILKEANPELYRDDVGVADIMAMCLRRESRVQHASHLLRDINTFWPAASQASLFDELHSLDDCVATLDAASSSSVFVAVASSHIRSLKQTLLDLRDGIYDASGDPHDMRSAANNLLGTLREGDEFVTVSLPAFWFPGNIGINGRFLSMCRNAAARGARVKRVLLINEDLSDQHLAEIVSAQLNATVDLDSAARPNFAIRYLLLSADRRRKLIASGKHFGLLTKDGEQIAMSPVYDTSDQLVTLRFRSGPRQVDGLRAAFEKIWNDARPLADLRLPQDSDALDAIEKLG
jgi:hypothetical protein